MATIEDVKKLDGRKPDKRDREAIENGSYVVVLDDGKADEGAREIGRIIEAAIDAGKRP